MTLPLATLQQLVQYCAQLVRESKELKTRIPDPERDGVADIAPTLRSQALDEVRTAPNAQSSENPRGGNLFYVDPTEITRLPREEILLPLLEDIWREVIPFKLQVLSERPEEMIVHEEQILTRFRGHDDVCWLFKGLERDSYSIGSEELKSRSVRLHYLICRWEAHARHCQALERDPIPPFNYEVMALLLTSVEQGVLCIGGILQRCYSLRALTQPKDSEPRSYLDHIWLVILNVLVLNGTFQLDWEFSPENLLRGFGLAGLYIEAIFNRRNSLEEVLGLTLPQLCYILHAIKQTVQPIGTLEAASGPNFRLSDLNIKSLRDIGGLSIVWTPYLEDHLRLDVKSKKLFVLWHEGEGGLRQSSLFGRFEEMYDNLSIPTST